MQYPAQPGDRAVARECRLGFRKSRGESAVRSAKRQTRGHLPRGLATCLTILPCWLVALHAPKGAPGGDDLACDQEWSATGRALQVR